jgi:hypothetical protein
MPRRSFVVLLALIIAGCADPGTSVTVKAAASARPSAAPAAAKPAGEAPPAPVSGGAVGPSLIAPNGATAVVTTPEPATGSTVQAPNPGLISNDGGSLITEGNGGTLIGASSRASSDPGGWSTSPAPSPTPGRSR